MSGTVLAVGPFKVEQFVEADQFTVDTNLNDTDLNDAFLNQSGLMAYYGVLLSRASYQTAEFKQKRDITIAKVSSEYRDNPPSDKKLTEKALDELVQQHPNVKAVVKAYNKAGEVEAVLKAGVEALRHRKDMIVQLGAASREEAKGAVRMKMSSETSDRGSALKDRLSGVA